MAENRLVDWGPLPLRPIQPTDYKVATWAEKEFKRIASDETDKPFLWQLVLPRHMFPVREQKWFDLP